jgi:hypothetical protein
VRRCDQTASLVTDLKCWLHSERARLSRHNNISHAMENILKRRPAFARRARKLFR